GYVATHPELRSPVTALSLGGLRRRIEIALLPEVDVDIRLELDRGARLERDRRRLQGRPRRPHAWSRGLRWPRRLSRSTGGSPRLRPPLVDRDLAIVYPLLVHPFSAQTLFSGQHRGNQACFRPLGSM